MPRSTEEVPASSGPVPGSAVLLGIAGGSALAGLLVFVLAGFSFSRGPAGSSPVPYPEGPPPGHTGGFGDPTCHACHFDRPLNPPGGEVEIRGLPAAGYAPGGGYELEVVLRGEGMKRAGFQATARLAGGGRAGTRAGTLVAGDGPRMERIVDPETGVAYVHQTGEGTDPLPGEGEARWSFRWTAPGEGSGSVVFHVAANAGNDDASEFGDRIYADSVVVDERTNAPPEGSGEARVGPGPSEPGSTGRW